MSISCFQFPEVRVVEASAGSGKTYALARRYVQLLLLNARAGDPALQPPFRPILALTFTNKAAFEMKGRILEFLKRISFNSLSAREADDILGPIGISPAEAATLARGAMEALIRNYNYFQVETIDKFINAILVGCAFKIGLTANFRIKTGSRAYMEQALDGLVDAARHDAAVRGMFESFIDNYLYLENRSEWLPQNGMLDILSSLFAVYDTYALPFTSHRVPPGEIIREKKIILALIRELSEKIVPDDLDARFVKSMTGFLERHQDGFDFDSLSDYFAREDIPAKKKAALTGEVYGLWDKIRRHIREVANLEVFCLYNPYLMIFDEVRRRYEAVCRREDVLFLSELNRKAAAIFDGSVTPEELYYRLASRFRHYLIDEFQDTSRLQWANLRMLPEEALSTGGSLFYVGDKKQAVYAFRGGDAGLFDEVKSEFLVDNLKEETLATNWRSAEAVVTFNNAVFSMENLARFVREKDDDDDGNTKKDAVMFSAGDMEVLGRIYGNARQSFLPQRQGGHVRMEYIQAKGREERLEAVEEKVIAGLRDLALRHYAWEDIAILARSNSEIEEITRWLLKAGIPAASERTADIREHPLVQEVVAFLTLMHTPLDNAAFAAFILGDIFLKASAMSRARIEDFLLSERAKTHTLREPYLYTAFRRVFPSEWEACIQPFFRNAGLYPVYELVVSFYGQMNVHANFPSAQGFLMHLLELIKNREEEYYDLGAFLADFETMEGEALYVKLAGQNAVRLLTFHKAKGLGFPAVILPFLAMKVEVGSGGADKKQSYVLRDKDGEMQFLRIKKDYGKYSDEAAAVYEDEYKKNFLSELNLMYVALTRASHEMIGFIPERSGNSRNLVRKLVPEAGLVAGVPAVYAGKSARGLAVESLTASAGRDWVHFLRDEFMGEGELAAFEEREEGEIMHAVLAQVGRASELEPLLEKMPVSSSTEKAVSLLRRFAKAAALGAVWDNPEARVLTEFELVDARGQTRRVDRLLLTDTTLTVIDFKMTRAQEAAGRIQVREYMDILSEIYPGLEIKGALVFIKECDACPVL